MPRTIGNRPAVEEALGRAAICRVLALALDYPAPARRAETLARWREVLDGGARWPAGARDVAAAALAGFAESPQDVLEAAHVRLFGPAGRAPLVETAWSDAGRLLGRSAALADLGGFYRAFAVAPATAHPRPEDHLAVELEFLSVLAVKEAWALAEPLPDALGVTREAAAAFLRDHLGTWVAAWAEAVASSDPPAAYAALAETIDRVVRAECAHAGIEPRHVDPGVRDPNRDGDCFSCPLATDA